MNRCFRENSLSPRPASHSLRSVIRPEPERNPPLPSSATNRPPAPAVGRSRFGSGRRWPPWLPRPWWGLALYEWTIQEGPYENGRVVELSLPDFQPLQEGLKDRARARISRPTCFRRTVPNRSGSFLCLSASMAASSTGRSNLGCGTSARRGSGRSASWDCLRKLMEIPPKPSWDGILRVPGKGIPNPATGMPPCRGIRSANGFPTLKARSICGGRLRRVIPGRRASCPFPGRGRRCHRAAFAAMDASATAGWVPAIYQTGLLVAAESDARPIRRRESLCFGRPPNSGRFGPCMTSDVASIRDSECLPLIPRPSVGCGSPPAGATEAHSAGCSTAGSAHQKADFVPDPIPPSGQDDK